MTTTSRSCPAVRVCAHQPALPSLCHIDGHDSSSLSACSRYVMTMTTAPPPRPVTVVGVDGSDTSIRASAYAAGMARRLDGRLLVVFVHTVGGLAAMAPAAVPALQQSESDIVAGIRSTLTLLADTTLAGIAIDVIERTGNPFHEITAVAHEHNADAVVVGASTQAGHRLVGSLATHLVRAAKWPVVVVP